LNKKSMLLILMMIESVPGTNKYTVRASIKNHAKENNLIWWRWRGDNYDNSGR